MLYRAASIIFILFCFLMSGSLFLPRSFAGSSVNSCSGLCNLVEKLNKTASRRAFELEKSDNFKNFYKKVKSNLKSIDRAVYEVKRERGKKKGFTSGKDVVSILNQVLEKLQVRNSVKSSRKFRSLKKVFYVFVSGSMPVSLLKTYAAEAYDLHVKKGYDFVFVIRGFIGTPEYLSPTLRWMISWDSYRAVKGLPGTPLPVFNFNELPPSAKKKFPGYFVVPVTINPEVFRHYNVKYVPAVSVKKPDREMSGSEHFDEECVVYGDAPLKTLVKLALERKCRIEGKIYSIREPYGDEQIKNYILKQEKDFKTRWKQIKEKLKNQVEKYMEHVYCPGFKPASRTETFLITGKYSLPFNIPDPENPDKVLYPAGYTFNPLAYVHFRGVFLVVDFSRDLERKAFLQLLLKASEKAFVKKGIVYLLVVGGSVNRAYKILLPYLLNPDSRLSNVSVYTGCYTLHRLHDIYHVPLFTPELIYQKGAHLVVTTFSASVLKKMSGAVLFKRCMNNSDCPTGYFCYFPECRNTGGGCIKKPEKCYQIWNPVCGCDNKTYQNACVLFEHGVSVKHFGACKSGH